MKKLLKFMLVLSLLVPTYVFVSYVSDESSIMAKTMGDYTYDVASDDTITIVNYNGSENEVIIPNEIDGKKVKKIGYAAFAECKSIESLTIPTSVTIIDSYAFSQCSQLKEIHIPDSVVSLGKYAFGACISLEEVILPNKIKGLGYGTFFDCIALKNVVFPEGLKSIGESTFGNCKSLVEINFPASLTSIEGNAFTYCISLQTLNLPEGLNFIGSGVFSGCLALEQVNLPESLSGIGQSAFQDCVSLERIAIPNTVSGIGYSAFSGCTNLKEINIPSALSSLGNAVFSGCSSLESMVIPSTITEIGNNVFSGCTNLKEVIIPDSVTSIGDEAFSYCSSLTSMTLPKNIETIPTSLFRYCSSLESIVIPTGVKEIKSTAFADCSNLISVTIPSSTSIFGSRVFSNSPLAVVSVASESAAYKYAVNNKIKYRIFSTGINLDKTQLQLKIGQNSTFAVIMSPYTIIDNKQVTWTSSNANVATVDAQGVVIGVNIGEAIITAQSANGQKASATVAVDDNEVAIEQITLSKTQMTMKKGTSEGLKATIDPTNTTTDKTLGWQSSNDQVVSVSSTGSLTARAPGEATITVTTTNGKQVSCQVTVISEIKSISLNQTSLVVEEGTKHSLRASINPIDTTDSKEITWVSSNPNVATVDAHGMVTTVAEGTVTISAISVNNKRAECKIRVLNAEIAVPITSVTLNKTSLTLTEGDKETIEATINPANTTDDKTLTWTTSDAKIATVKATSITFNKDSKTSTAVNGLAQVSAKVAPTNVSNPFYNVTSSNEAVAKIIKVPTETDYYYVVQGVSAGTVTLTATSEDGAFTDTMEFIVVDGVDTTLINEKFAAFEALRVNLYTKASYDEAKAVYEEAKALLETESVTQDQVDAITVKLVKAIDALEFRGSNPDQPSSANLIFQDRLARFDESSMSASEKESSAFTIDGKTDTIWHSNYSSSYKLPQYVTIDLGAEYLLEQVDMLPRQNTTNGHITHYRIEVSSDEGENKTFVPVVEGFFKHDGTGLVAPEVAKEVKFDATSARYVRFIAIESLGDRPNAYASIAELNFYGVEAMPSIEEALKEGLKIVKKEEKYTTSSYAAFFATYAKLEVLAESSDATASEVNKALAEMYATIEALDTRASEDLVIRLTDNVAAFKALEADYTAEEFADMKAAITMAEAILEKAIDNIASKEATLANNALLMAKVELGKLADADQLLDNLAMVIEIANETLATEENVRPSSIKAVKDAVEVGQALIDSGSTDRAAIKASIESITKAVQELYKIVDKTELKELIALAESITGNFTEATAKELADAIAAAKVVSTNDDATTIEVADANSRLSNAILNLKVTANKEALATQIAITEKIIANIANYVPSSVAGIDTVLAKANGIFADEAAKQAQVDAMVKELTTANLKARMKADKKALETAIRKARSVDVAGYTASSAMNLRNAIANAEKVFANENATQDEVNSSVIAIDHAISRLAKVETPDGSTSNRPGNTTGGTTVRTPVRNNTGGTTARPATPNEDVTTDVVEEPKEDVKIEDQETPQAIVKTPTSNTNNWLLAGAMSVILLAGAGFFLVLKKKRSE